MADSDPQFSWDHIIPPKKSSTKDTLWDRLDALGLQTVTIIATNARGRTDFCDDEGHSRHDGLALRPVADKWEGIYRADASLYSARVVGSHELADKDLAKHNEALEATGWREG